VTLEKYLDIIECNAGRLALPSVSKSRNLFMTGAERWRCRELILTCVLRTIT